MAKAKRQRPPSTQALNQLKSSSIDNFDPEMYPMVSVQRMSGRTRPRIMPNEMGGWNVATRPDPNAGLPDIATNPDFSEDMATRMEHNSNIAGPGGFGFGSDMSITQPSWAKFFDVIRQKGARIGPDRSPEADWFSGPAKDRQDMLERPGTYLTKTATDWSRSGRGQATSNMATSLKGLEDTLYEDARREQVAGRDKFRASQDRARGRRM